MLVRATTLLLAAIATLIAVVPASAGAQGSGSVQGSKAASAPVGAPKAISAISTSGTSVKAGKTMSVTVRISNDSVRSCRLSIIRRGKTYKRSKTVGVTTALITWKWKVPTGARNLTWKTSVACKTASKAARPASKSFRVRGAKRGRVKAPAGSISVRRHGGMPDQFLDEQEDDEWNAGNGGNGDKTPIPYQRPRRTLPVEGQCTEWAAYWRQDDIPDSVFRTFAGDWDVAARNLGFPVDNIARKGDIAVWDPGMGRAASTGHVAFVEDAVPDEYGGLVVTVSEMNWGGNLRATTRVLTPDRASTAMFIHRR